MSRKKTEEVDSFGVVMGFLILALIVSVFVIIPILALIG